MNRFLFLSLFLCGCSSLVPESSVPTPTVEYHAAWPNAEWTKIVADEAGPADARCAVAALSNIAKWESNFDPKSTFRESDGVDSLGLLQLSVVDGGRYGCDFKTAADVYDVKKNLQCGVRVFKKLRARDGGILASGSTNADAKGAARYWSVIREGSTHHKAAIMAGIGQECQ